MEQTSSAHRPQLSSIEAEDFALINCANAQIGHEQRSQRLLKISATLACSPGQSLPQAFGNHADLIGAYRFLSNPEIDPQDIIAPHTSRILKELAGHDVALCVQDDTELCFTTRTGMKNLGQIGAGGRGLLQHSSLAVLPDGRVLGLLDVRWVAVQPTPEGETRRQRQARWNLSDLWADVVRKLGVWDSPTRLLHVCDRAADMYRLMAACVEHKQGFVIRAQHDRRVDEDTTRLWAKLDGEVVLGRMKVKVGGQRDAYNRETRRGREAEVTIRAARVLVSPPVNDPRTEGGMPVTAWAVYVKEENPPAEIARKGEAIEWMLLSSEPVEDLASARVVVGYYTRRWTIEEWHRAYKEGCAIEKTQLDDGADVQRLGAILCPIAVLLLRMRDLADERHPDSSNPAALRCLVSRPYIVTVSLLAGVKEEQLTPRQFLATVAKRGGYLGRRSDGRPGWKVLWRGWKEITAIVEGAMLIMNSQGKAVR